MPPVLVMLLVSHEDKCYGRNIIMLAHSLFYKQIHKVFFLAILDRFSCQVVFVLLWDLVNPITCRFVAGILGEFVLCY